MVELIDKNRSALIGLCKRFGVYRLYLFGSGTTDRFQPAKSDLDFLVCFTNRQPTGDYADRYLDLADELERLFGRPVDLVTEQAIRNPYFQREVEATRQLLYEESNAKTVI